VLGFGMMSNLWSILDYTQPTGPYDDATQFVFNKFDVYMTTFNNPTFADATYVPTTTQSLLTFNGFSTDYDLESDPSTSFTANSQRYLGNGTTSYVSTSAGEFKSFGFGQTNTANSSAYYEGFNYY
jgi:hypothetical protein